MSRPLALDHAAWSSPWRTRSVRDKGFLVAGLLLCALVLPPFPGGVATLMVCLVLLLGPVGVAPRLLARISVVPLVSILIGVATVAISVGWANGPTVAVTPAGLATAGALLVRALAATAALFVLAASTPVVDLVEGLHRARVPAPLIEITMLVYRFTVELLGAAGAIGRAQEARLGYVDRRAALRSASMAVSVLFLRTWERARTLERGLAGRGYEERLTTLAPERRRSATFLAMSAALVGAVALGSWAAGGLA